MNRAEYLARQIALDHGIAPSNVCGWHMIGIIGTILLVVVFAYIVDYCTKRK